jgi:sarcosine oxidase subunit alpha
MTARRLRPGDITANTPLAAHVTALAAAARVGLTHDDARVEAVPGEPLALALLAADRLVLSRSPKLHRARGPACLRGHCEGCLVRVDDAPNVMSCRARVRGGEVVRSQNAFPTAALDVFAVADWFFPKGMDHHHLFVGAGRALNESMQYVARKMSGLGTLPETVARFDPARRLTTDVLVIGGGASGVAAANALRRKGFDVVLAELGQGPGGSLLDDPTHVGPTPTLDAAARALFDTGAVACFDDVTLLEDARGILEVRARARVFANGTHDVLGAFAGNDLPGVFSARAVCKALRHGVLPGERWALGGDGPWTRRAREALSWVRGVRVEGEADATVVEARGGRRVDGATLARGDALREVRCDAAALEGTAAASYELAGQAGAACGGAPPGGASSRAPTTTAPPPRPGCTCAARCDRARWTSPRARTTASGARVPGGRRPPRGGCDVSEKAMICRCEDVTLDEVWRPSTRATTTSSP